VRYLAYYIRVYSISNCCNLRGIIAVSIYNQVLFFESFRLNYINKSYFKCQYNLIKLSSNAADVHIFYAVRSTDAITASASKPTADAVQPYHAMMRKSRKSISLDDLQTAGNDSSVADLADDLDPQSQSVMYARNMNQSFRVAVDKSYDGASLAASLAGL